MRNQPCRIAIFGLGYVGCVTAACLSKLGNSVIGVDLDENKVKAVQSGKSPFFEPGLDSLVSECVEQGLLSATRSAAEAVAASDVAFLCVGTPSAQNGNIGLDQLRRVAVQVSEALAGTERPYTVIVRSTVFPGTCDDVVKPVFAQQPNVQVVANPEFLREGTAIADFTDPSLIVIGGAPEPAEHVAALYAPLGTPVSHVSLRTAELIKYACNAFHAVKIGFANEIGTLAEELGINPAEVMDTLCQDERLNISRAYLKPGPAFGGSCLPKDLRALNYKASRLDLELPLLNSVLPSNEQHQRRGVSKVLSLPTGTIGVFGLTFKENTDDLRESPVVNLLEELIGKGRGVCVFDPHLRIEEIYGSNRSFVLDAIPHIAKLLKPSLDQMIQDADFLVVTQKPSEADLETLASAGLPIVNLVGAMAGRLAYRDQACSSKPIASDSVPHHHDEALASKPCAE